MLSLSSEGALFSGLRMGVILDMTILRLLRLGHHR
uniref:Uncharacterized protein n=1 Tax=Anguilla anguilla TaxID=7936 RepID=A0A0E9VFV9_ANGAN